MKFANFLVGDGKGLQLSQLSPTHEENIGFMLLSGDCHLPNGYLFVV